MTISDFDGAFFWPAIRTFVTNAGIEPISLGEPEDEVWRKIFAAAAAAGSPLSFGMTPGELMRAAYALAQGGGSVLPSPVYGDISVSRIGSAASAKDGDGSTGQTYTINADWTDVQWYRMALPSPYGLTAIPGATSLSYVAQAADEGYRLAARGKLAGVDVAAKALHVVYPQPVLLDNFEAGWEAPTGGGVLDLDGGRIRLTGTGTVNAQVVKADIGSFDPSTMGTVAYRVDAGMDEGRQTMLNHRVVLRRDGVDQFLANVTTTDLMYETPSPHLIGDLWGSYHVSEVPGLATPGVSSMGVYLRHAGNAPYVATAKYGPLLGKAGGRTTVVVGADDLKLSWYQNARPIMKARNLPYGLYIAAQLTQNSAFQSTAMIQEQYSEGADAYLNSTYNDDRSWYIGPDNLQTMAAWEASFQQNRDYAIANGMIRGNEHICYTHGQIEAYPNPGPLPSSRIVSTSVVSDGSDIVTVGGTLSTLR